MAQFKIGDPVVKIDSDAHGTVINVRSGRGRVIYTVVFGDGTQSTVLEPDLRADFDVSDPFERCKSGIFGSYSDYSKKTQRLKSRTPTIPLSHHSKRREPCFGPISSSHC